MAESTKITAVIITYNEEQKIERCLRSLDWVDEIVVLDSFSTDCTVEICRRYTEKVYQHPWPNSTARQRSIADQHATNDWILALDADEVVTKGVRDEILGIFKSKPDSDVYGIPRMEYLAGKWIKSGGWYPQHKLILYRRSMGEWSGGPVHLMFTTRGTVRLLENPILHDGAPTFKVFMNKFNHYSSVEAEADYQKINRKFSIVRALFKPFERFFGRYIKHQGYKDGVHGLFMAVVIAINYFLREMKIYEHRYRERHSKNWDSLYYEAAVGAAEEDTSTTRMK